MSFRIVQWLPLFYEVDPNTDYCVYAIKHLLPKISTQRHMLNRYILL
jgi:hypothetical protein